MRFLNIVLNNLIWFLVLSAFVFFSLASDRFLGGWSKHSTAMIAFDAFDDSGNALADGTS